MKKNPKMIAGVAALAVLVILGAVLLTQMIPTIREVQREMSLTPTPLPQMPDTVWAEVINAGEPTPEPALSNGSQGEKVAELQKRLQALRPRSGAGRSLF